jgi:predicted RND superfamily exporter protein
LQEIHGLTQDFLAELPDLDADARRHQRALEFLERLAGAKPLDPATLPRWAREPFMEKDGRTDAIAHVYVKIRGSHIDELIALKARLAELTQGTGVVVADSRLVFADLMSLLERDARTLPSIAALVVLVLLGMAFRRVGATLACTAAMALGVAVTLAVMAALPIRINFFNLVVMPAVLGLGIDTTIYLWNSRSQPGLGPTSVAALLSAATTIAGFSGLLFASHPGLRSIGQLGVLAIGACVTVAFLALWPSRARG